MESHKRSAAKSFVWRITGVVILALITYAFTRELITTTLITLCHHGVFLVIFYLHERAWLKIEVKNFTHKSILKMFTYETILGNVILGTITYIFTGNIRTMAAVTLTYIGIKHAVYIINEFVWRQGVEK